VPVTRGKRLDLAVRTLFGASWGDARRWIATGKVTVDGEVVTDEAAEVDEGADVELRMNAPRPRGAGELEASRVVHVDAHVVVVDKPPGVSTVPYEGGEDEERDTLDAMVRAYLAHKEKSQKAKNARPALGVVHRIDKETSGLLVFTRTWLAKKSLSSQFRAHTVHRRYLAVAAGVVASRTIRSELVENRGDGLRGSLKGNARAAGPTQTAVTHVEALEVLGGRATLVACRLETGRTHQIRIHLSEAGHPIVGDRVYVRGYAGEILHAPRLMLHAAELGFIHPATEREVRYTRDPPPDFAGVVARLRGTQVSAPKTTGRRP
jgi:23S rRNA pseudouridine1911/1915/1917 synthase